MILDINLSQTQWLFCTRYNIAASPLEALQMKEWRLRAPLEVSSPGSESDCEPRPPFILQLQIFIMLEKAKTSIT